MDKTKIMTAVPGKDNEFKDNLKVTIEYAKAVGAKKIHIMAGKLDTVSSENWTTYDMILDQYAADLLKQDNILGFLEPINQHSVPEYFLSDYGKDKSHFFACTKFRNNLSCRFKMRAKLRFYGEASVLRTLNSPHIKLQLDIYHLQHICGDLSHNIKNLMPYVGHVQIAQVPNCNVPDTVGEVNYPYILQHLEQCGYNDWIGLEYKPAAGSKAGLNSIQSYGYTL